ncbi:MAG: ABC-type transport auxiliary lipoprotein family protein [Hyphomonadaceae bacterium]
MINAIRMLTILAAAGALTGCIRLLPEPPPPNRIFAMSAAPAPPAPAAAAKPIVIAVSAPTTTRALGGDDLAWRKDGALSYVEGAIWEGRAADLLQRVLTSTIDRSGLVFGAVRSGDGRADVEVRWDLYAFEINEDGDALEARLQANVKLVEARTRALIASMELDERAPVADRGARIAALALEQTARQAAMKITAWSVANAPTPAPGRAAALLPSPGAAPATPATP